MTWLSVSLLVRWLLGWLLGLRLPLLPAAKPTQSRSVSVLIPARNEEASLPHLLEALTHQSFIPSEVIVIDDASTDATASVALAARTMLPLHLIQSPSLPPGWCGKTWALHNGVLASSGDVLVFFDADCEPDVDCLASLVAQQECLGGLVSVQPFHRTEQPYEQLSLLFNLVGLMSVPLGPGCGVAFGPAMATSRQDYDRVGGRVQWKGRVFSTR